MNIHLHAKYRAGAIHPDKLLNLPDGAAIDVIITAAGRSNGARPPAPRFSAEELLERLERHGVSVGSLPADFSRADIYQDRD